MRRRPPRSTLTDTLFPYTTLFLSGGEARHRPAVPVGRVAALARFPVLWKDHLAAAVLDIVDQMRGQRATVIGEHRKGVDHFFDRRRAGTERGRQIGFVLADAHPLDRLDDRFHSALAGGWDRPPVWRRFQAPAAPLLPP